MNSRNRMRSATALCALLLSATPAAAQTGPGARPAPAAMQMSEPVGERLPPAMAGDERVGLTAEDIHQRIEDQLVAGVARPRIDLHIEFDFNSARLTEAGRRDLDEAGSTLSRWYLDDRFRLGGHTDDSGPSDYNLSLSLERARSARRYLIEKFAIAPERLEARGYGESRPLPGQAAEKNRRVALELIR